MLSPLFGFLAALFLVVCFFLKKKLANLSVRAAHLEQQLSRYCSEQEKSIHALTQSLPEAMIMTNVEGKILTLNPAAYTFFNLSPDQTPQYLLDLILPHDQKNVEALLKTLQHSDHHQIQATIHTLGTEHQAIKLILSRWTLNHEEQFSVIFHDADKLQRTEEFMRGVFDEGVEAMLISNASGKILRANQRATQLFGYTVETLKTLCIEDLIPTRFRNNHRSHREEFGKRPSRRVIMNRGVDLYALRASGEEFPVEIDLNVFHQSNETQFVATISDISERIKAQSALKQSEECFRAAFEFAPIGIALISLEGIFLQSNAALNALLECSHEELTRHHHRDFTYTDDYVHEENQLRQLLSGTTPSIQFEKRYITQQGQIITVIASVVLLQRNKTPLYYLYQIQDITERKEYESQILHLAHFDALTGLANRTRLSEELNRLIISTQRTHRVFALAYCDLDHFKRVNDTLGHEAGDKLLQTVAKRIMASLRETDTVARLGGDEFVILLANIDTPEYAGLVIQKVMAQIALPMTLDEVETHVGSSFGVALYPIDGKDAPTLLRNADSALYEAKAQGRNNVQFYRDELTEHVEKRLHLANDLRNALEYKQFILYFQPIVDLYTGRIIALEAFVRWQHPMLGLLLPESFIPFAEESGMITALGEWVIHAACRARADWKQLEHEPIGIAMNVSSRHFKNSNLIQTIVSAIEESQISPSDIIIEITERTLLDSPDHNQEIITALKHLGVSIALDNFGVGYSSLNYAIRFAPNHLKIDRSFIAAVGQSTSNTMLVESIIELSTKFQMSTVAEGIETHEQLEFLKTKGCNAGQGYFFTHPLSETELHVFLAKQQSFQI
jgi:diguanylate cyclase (GGDEF)-like protein/PAS domain S-box-containing protein